MKGRTGAAFDFVPWGAEQPWYGSADQAPEIERLVRRHRDAVPGVAPASLTKTANTFEGEYVSQDRPNGPGHIRKTDLLDAFCRCGRKLVKLTPAEVRRGEVGFCTHPSCESGEPEVAKAKRHPRRRTTAPRARDDRTRRTLEDQRVVFLAPTVPATPDRDPRLADFPMEKFWKRIWVDHDCWIWTGAKIPAGYGQMSRRVDGKVVTVRAHRLAYEMLVGPIAPDLEIDHLCRRRACVNPAHLEAVRHTVNVGRGMAAQRTREAALRRSDYWYESGVVA